MKVHGPYDCADGRKRMQIIRDDGSKTSKSYAKFLYEQKYGEIPDGMEVDHINDDYTDDRIDNLQVISKLDNIMKSVKPAPMTDCICPECNKEFKREARVIRHKQGKRKNAGPFCSKKCSGRRNQRIQAGLC